MSFINLTNPKLTSVQLQGPESTDALAAEPLSHADHAAAAPPLLPLLPRQPRPVQVRLASDWLFSINTGF